MRLERLTLKDFRGFEQLTLDLDRPVTVLVGTNGSGKSSIVRALELLASHAAAHALGREGAAMALHETDVREGSTATSLNLLVGGKNTGVSYHLQSGATTQRLDIRPPLLPPLVVTLDATRARLFLPPPAPGPGVTMSARGTITSRHPAWDETVRRPLTFEWSEDWFRAREDLENQKKARGDEGTQYSDPGLVAVRRAIEAVLPGYRKPSIDRERPAGNGNSQLVLTNAAGAELPAHLLSDGERSLMVLALTVARRLSLLTVEQKKTIGGATVVIDEIELHLHPRWQREVIPRLTNAFPECQFIVTTHSPQVIASVDADSLIVLDRFSAKPAPAPTHGRDSNAILEEIMGTSDRPADMSRRLRVIEGLVDSGNLDEAKSKVAELAKEWGDDDREVVRLSTAIDFRGLDAVDS